MSTGRWAWLYVWVDVDDALIRSKVGPADQDRDDAVAAVQAVLDASQVLGAAARTWSRGAADDTVYVTLQGAPHVWTVVKHDGDPRAAAHAWLVAYAQIIRQASGLDVQIARLP